MSSDFVPAGAVHSPKRLWKMSDVIFDGGACKTAAATGFWDGRRVLAIRWNGERGKRLGNPQSSGHAVWFIVPDDLRCAVLANLSLAPEKRALAQEFFRG